MKDKLLENAEHLALTIDKMSDIELFQLEEESRKINGVLLSDYQSLVIEKIKLKSAFAFDSIEQLDFNDSLRVKDMLERLEIDIQNEADFDQIKDIIVLLGLMLDVDITYYFDFLHLLNNGTFDRIKELDVIDYNNLKNIVTYGGRSNSDGFNR